MDCSLREKFSLNKFIFLGVLFSLLSSLRLPFLPEFQVFLIFILFVLSRGFGIRVAAILICVLCTHHYAVPDVTYRIDGADYPSIYTRAYGPVKILDFLVVFLLTIAMPRIASLKRILLNKYFPSILFLILPFGLFSIPFGQQNIYNFLFLIRSGMIVFSIFSLFSKYASEDIGKLSLLAIFCWISKMFFSIMFPADNPMFRDLLGFQWNIFFAGDEYLTLGVYLCAILCLARLDPVVPVNWSLLCLLMSLGMLFALLAQRKGSVSYFGLIFLVVLAERFYKLRILSKLTNFIIYINPWTVSLFLLLIYPYLPDLLQLAFLEYANLLDSALASLFNLAQKQPLNFILGIGPAGMYEILNLLPINDHATSFGKEVGESFRYAIWSIPYGRLILNVGLIGFGVVNFYLLWMIRSVPCFYYLYASAIPIFYMGNVTPPTALALGLGMVPISRYLVHRRRN